MFGETTRAQTRLCPCSLISSHIFVLSPSILVDMYQLAHHSVSLVVEHLPRMREVLGLNSGAARKPPVFLMGRDVPRYGTRLLVGVHISKGAYRDHVGGLRSPFVQPRTALLKSIRCGRRNSATAGYLLVK